MKHLIITLLLGLFSISFSASAQKFNSDVKALNAQIESSKKSGKLTEVEYGKLKKEVDMIKLAIDKASADDIMTPDEKNKIHSKIVKARKRLAKYKVNREIY